MVSTLSSANVTDVNLVLKERTHMHLCINMLIFTGSLSEGDVQLSKRFRQTVPQHWPGGSKTAVTKLVAWSLKLKAIIHDSIPNVVKRSSSYLASIVLNVLPKYWHFQTSLKTYLFIKSIHTDGACDSQLAGLASRGNIAQLPKTSCVPLQPGTVYLLRYEPLNCRWAPSSACWRLSFFSMHEPSSSAIVTEQQVRRRIQISGQLNSILSLSSITWDQAKCGDALSLGQ